jgi:translation initiation factor eIF-2B subunit beta
VAQAAPAFNGHDMALALSSAGIDTTLIDDQAVFALMARVNKVVISAAAVLADGTVVAQSGAHLVALAAKAYNVPFVACCGLYKLSPTFEKLHVPLASPADVLRFGDVGAQLEHVHVDNPVFDYVPPNLVSLLLTNFGGTQTSYVYRLLAETADPEDKFI